MRNNIRYIGNINDTSVIIFLIGNLPSLALAPFCRLFPPDQVHKLPAMVLAWENLQEVFVMLIVAVVFLPHWRFFINCFSTSSSLTLPWATPGFYTHFILSAQLIADWVAILSFSPFLASPSHFYHKCYGFERFLPTGGWLGCTHPIEDLLLCLPSQSCLIQLMHGLELLIFGL